MDIEIIMVIYWLTVIVVLLLVARRIKSESTPLKPDINSIQVLSVNAGDTIVLMVRDALSKEQMASVSAYLSAAISSDVKVLVLDRGMTLAAIMQQKPIPYIPQPSNARR